MNLFYYHHHQDLTILEWVKEYGEKEIKKGNAKELGLFIEKHFEIGGSISTPSKQKSDKDFVKSFFKLDLYDTVNRDTQKLYLSIILIQFIKYLILFHFIKHLISQKIL